MGPFDVKLPAAEAATLERHELTNILLDELFALVDDQIDISLLRLGRGDKPAAVFAEFRTIMARARKATYDGVDTYGDIYP
jgi:hypothetical protein